MSKKPKKTQNKTQMTKQAKNGEIKMAKYEIIVNNLEKPYDKTKIITPNLANKNMALTWIKYNRPFKFYGIISIRKLSEKSIKEV